MGNKQESPSGIVQVTSFTPIPSSSPIESKLSSLSIDKPLSSTCSPQDPSQISKFLSYYIPLHKYRASALIKDQENVIKKCESIQSLSEKTLIDQTQSFLVSSTQLFKNKQNKIEIQEELNLLRQDLDQLNQDLSKIESVLVRLSEVEL